jgi:hypothetical protein
MPADEPTPEPVRLWPRRLRVGLAMACLTLCFTTVAFWVQSYRQNITLMYFSTKSLIGVNSGQGRITIVVVEPAPLPAPPGWHAITRRDLADWSAISFGPAGGILGFNYEKTDESQSVILVPHWALVLLPFSLAVLFRPPPRTRFGLRELLVAVTLAAVSFGGVEVFVRATPESRGAQKVGRLDRPETPVDLRSRRR